MSRADWVLSSVAAAYGAYLLVTLAVRGYGRARRGLRRGR